MSVSPSPSPSTPEDCLREYVGGEKSANGFQKLVNLLGGLSYQTALHITGDQGLAEEAVQRVFVILDRKAKELQCHPSLSPWVHRTSRYEAKKILNREVTHRKRLEKFTLERMDEIDEPEVFSRENWRLLDEAIDQLKTKDRTLVLARFFEGKKFREIAVETNSTEAACKVRLRRVMDRMSGWLAARGCTLSAATIAPLLGAEWSRACPSALAAKASSLVAASSPSLPITKILTTMKISKMTASGLVLLLAAGFSPFLIKKFSESKTEESIDFATVSLSDRRFREDPQWSKRQESVKQILANYPYAYDRLEELYQKYPNLRPRSVEVAKGVRIMDRIAEIFSARKETEIPWKSEVETSNLEKWDDEKIERVLEEFRGLIDEILEASKQSVLGDGKRYSIDQATPGVVEIVEANKWLRLELVQSIRSGKLEQAEQVMAAYMRLEEAASIPNLFGAICGQGSRRTMVETLTQLSKMGYDVTPYVEKMGSGSEQEFLANAMRIEFAESISYFEAARQVRDREALLLYWGSEIFGGLSGAKYYNPSAKSALRDQALNADFREVQEHFAEVFSRSLTSEKSARESTSLDQALFQNRVAQLADFDFSQDRFLFLSEIGATVVPALVSGQWKVEQERREMLTWSALQQAGQAGMELKSLDDLVPTFLPTVPVNAASGEPFKLDVELGKISFSKGNAEVIPFRRVGSR